MQQVARYGHFKARPGCGAELARLLLEAAVRLEATEACRLYLVSRQAIDPDEIWVTELWRTREELNEVLAGMASSTEIAAAREYIAESEVVELDLLGGKGINV